MLGLEPGASGAEIKQAYRDLVIVWHPDRFPGNSRLQKIATEKLKEFNLAYQELMEFVENTWYENLFGFEDEEFTREAEQAEDVQGPPENSAQGHGRSEKEESRMEHETGSDAKPHTENAETHDWFEEGGGFTHKAEDAHDTQIHLEGAEVLAWLDKGYDFLKNGRLNEAVSSFEKALEMNSSLKEAWIAKALTLEKLGKLEEGLTCLERALEIDHNSEDAWIAKGNMLYSIFKNQQALDCYDRALAINPKNAEVSYRRWVALQQTFSYRQPFLLDAGKERSTNMPNDLIGNLSEARLFNIIKSLVDRRKSGMVAIEGKNPAELYIEGGNIVHGKTDGLIGEEAVLAMMDFDEGRVLFNWQLSPEKQTVRTPTEQLMSIWSQRDEEWKKVRKVMPTFNAIFSIVLDSGGEDRNIPAKLWSVLALCNGERTVSEIAGLLGQPVFEVSKTISKMVEMGVLVETGGAGNSRAPDQATVDEIFFAAVETELKKVVGPIARVIIDDTLAAFDEPRNAFPKHKIMSFIKTVSDQIIEDRKRGQFEEACNTLESIHSDF